jgi:hypothetical protein
VLPAFIRSVRTAADAVAPALLDRADGAPGVAEFRQDGAAHLGRTAQMGVVDVAFKRRGRFGVVQQEIAAGALDAFETAATQPARATDPFLHVLAAVPVLEQGIVGRIDVDPQRQHRLAAGAGHGQLKALKVMRVKVSFTPASVWILLVTK